MNDKCNIFIYSIIAAQHLLNKPLDKRKADNWLPFLPQQPFSVVENLLRAYIVYYQHYSFIFNNSTKYQSISSCFLPTV